jgi:tetratricopeptide (TPR) repeat protein
VTDDDPVAPSQLVPRVPRDLDTICLKCLHKELARRYESAEALAEDLERYLRGEPIKARRIPFWERGAKWVRRRPWAAASGFLGISLLFGLIAGLFTRSLLERSQMISARLSEGYALQHDADNAQLEGDLEKSKERLIAFLPRLELVQDDPDIRRLSDLLVAKRAELSHRLDNQRSQQDRERATAEIQQRYRLFCERRKEALFRDTQFTGLMLPMSPDLTCKAAEQALGVFATGSHGESWMLDTLPAVVSREQQAEVREGCYELLLVLAEAVATQDANQVDRALRILDSARRLRPNPSRAYHMAKASCLARKGDHAGEAGELAEAGRVRDETAFDYYLSGHDQYMHQRWADAIQDFETALRLKPDHFWAQCLLAICYYRTTRFEGAKSGLTACLQGNPDLAWLYYFRALASGQIAAKYLGLVQHSPGREAALRAGAEFEFHEAEADFREALARLGSKPDEQLHSIVLYNRGLVRFQRGRLDEAAADYRQVIELKKDLYLAYAALAHVAKKQGDFAGAIDQFTRAIAVKPDSAPLYRGRADARLASGDPSPQDRAAALADLELAIRHEQPDNPVLALDHTNRGKLLYRDGQLEVALEECRLALRAVPDHFDAHILRIQVLLKLKRHDDAISSCDVVLAQGRKSALLYELRVLAQEGINTKDYAGAIEDASAALTLSPEQGKYRLLLRRGCLYLSADAPRLALRDFEQAIRLDPSNGEAYAGRGSARLSLGEHREAVADAEKALSLGGPNSRLIYDAARVYALAAVVATAEVRKGGQESARLLTKYQDRAAELLHEYLKQMPSDQRAAFWRDVIQPDPPLRALQSRLSALER